MTNPLTGRRSRSDLIAELYDRHATGLFAYCHDQLGDPGSAADALVALFTGLPAAETPRAVLYSLARREIARRDVVYRPPAVDGLADPATALIERVFRELRPHQREVLLLSAVCGLGTEELAWVLDVAVDTAGELAAAARHRFSQCLATATAEASSAAYVPPAVAEVYGALTVAPIEDILARLPWRHPSSAVLSRILESEPTVRHRSDRSAPSLRMPGPVKPLWPTTPVWPLPLAEPDEVTGTTLIPAAVPPRSGHRSAHEASTEPMPRLRGPVMDAMAAKAAASALAAPVTEAAPAAEAATETPAAESAEAAAVVSPPAGEPSAATAAEDGARATVTPAARKAGGTAPHRHKRVKPVKVRERHYDWLWELAGFLVCLAIAMLVFFAMPTIIP